eukprot:98022-Hanusia_phi.AAC.1
MQKNSAEMALEGILRSSNIAIIRTDSKTRLPEFFKATQLIACALARAGSRHGSRQGVRIGGSTERIKEQCATQLHLNCVVKWQT